MFQEKEMANLEDQFFMQYVTTIRMSRFDKNQ